MGEFEFVPHTADIAARIEAQDLRDLLRTAALSVAAAISDQDNLTAYRSSDAHPYSIHSEEAPDEEGLLVNFLNEVIFRSETRGEIYTDLEILGYSPEDGVRALAYPDPLLEPVVGVKAATYYDLHIINTPNGVEVTVVFDV